MDTVVLAVERGSPIVGFVDALGRLGREGMPRSAVVGGVAVMCRLATAHRPTADIDAVVRDDAVPSAAEMLVAQGATRTTTGVDLGGVRIDLLEVGDVPTPADLPDDQLDRAFVTGHAWALATAEPVNVIARSMRGGTLASAEVDLATPASLVAMKLHAIRKRREARLVKRGSDAYDIYRLLALLDADGSIGVVLRQAPAGLGEWCASEVEAHFTVDAERTLLWIGNALASGTVFVVADDLRAVGAAFVLGVRDTS